VGVGAGRVPTVQMAFQTQYHEDSDADDEYERSIIASPQPPTDSEASPTDSEFLSSEHTPKTYGNSMEEHGSPRAIITEWTAEECAEFVASLGLRQYRTGFLG
jgi:protein STE50